MHKKWSAMKKLIWLKRTVLRAAGTILKTVMGIAPLRLGNSVTGTIHTMTQYGKCVQDGTPTPDAPVDIVCNNGALKYSANMANVSEQTASIGHYINAQGAVLADVYNWFYRSFIPVKPNTTYMLSMSTPVYYVTISEYSTADDSGFIIRKTGTTGGNTSLTITTGANTNFVRFGSNLNRVVVTMEMVLAINWMLNLGGTAMDYQQYVEGGVYADGTPEVLTVSADGGATQTAYVPMLLSIGDHNDEVELIHGILTHKVGVLVFDGSEGWRTSTSGTNIYILSSEIAVNLTAICTHFAKVSNTTSSGNMPDGSFRGHPSNSVLYFKYDSVGSLENFKEFLAAQYAAGTPVIMAYSLATETTDHITPHHLHTTAGTNIVDVTSAVDPVELKAEYYATD